MELVATAVGVDTEAASESVGTAVVRVGSRLPRSVGWVEATSRPAVAVSATPDSDGAVVTVTGVEGTALASAVVITVGAGFADKLDVVEDDGGVAATLAALATVSARAADGIDKPAGETEVDVVGLAVVGVIAGATGNAAVVGVVTETDKVDGAELLTDVDGAGLAVVGVVVVGVVTGADVTGNAAVVGVVTVTDKVDAAAGVASETDECTGSRLVAVELSDVIVLPLTVGKSLSPSVCALALSAQNDQIAATINTPARMRRTRIRLRGSASSALTSIRSCVLMASSRKPNRAYRWNVYDQRCGRDRHGIFYLRRRA
jgi:hypothetical protein